MTTREWIKGMLVVMALAFAGCGGEELPDACQGEEGRFVAIPILSMNNCTSTPTALPEMQMDIPEDSDLRKCGWHELTENEDTSPVTGCNSRMSHSLRTGEEDYRGFIVLDVTCATGSCLAVWELEFFNLP
jgi:hypothetical protein